MAFPSPVSLDSLPHGLSMFPVIVRVDRVIIQEHHLSFSDPPFVVKKIVSVDIILWDLEGTRMIATMKQENVISGHSRLFSSPKCYELSGFVKKDNGLGVHDKFHIELCDTTIVKELSICLPDRVFNVKCPSTIPWGIIDRSGYVDLCGYVRYASPVRVKPFCGFLEKEMLIILESRTKYNLFTKDHVKVYLRGSLNATRVLFNPKIDEVKTFVASCKDGVTPICTPLSQTFSSSYQSQQPSSVMLSKDARIPISEIPKQKLNEAFVVNCEFIKLETTHGWVYDGCAKCSSKVKEEGGSLKCLMCKRTPHSIQPKLKIHYTISDNSGTASVVFWDKFASQLVDKSAAQLKSILKEEKREYDIPDELDGPVGKRALIQLKRNHYNVDHPSSSISVVQFILCEDLLEPFDQADDAGDAVNAVHANSDDHPVSNTVLNDSQDDSTQSPIMPTCVDLVDDDDIPLSALSRTAATRKKRTRTKGKTQAQGVIDKHPKTLKKPAQQQMMKIIKKEK